MTPPTYYYIQDPGSQIYQDPNNEMVNNMYSYESMIYYTNMNNFNHAINMQQQQQQQQQLQMQLQLQQQLQQQQQQQFPVQCMYNIGQFQQRMEPVQLSYVTNPNPQMYFDQPPPEHVIHIDPQFSNIPEFCPQFQYRDVQAHYVRDFEQQNIALHLNSLQQFVPQEFIPQNHPEFYILENNQNLNGYTQPLAIDITNKQGRNGSVKETKSDKAYRCTHPFCTAFIKRKDDLARHMRTHTGEKPFICGVCKKTFSRRDHLRSHERTHTKERPFGCDYCDRRFARSDERKRHTKTHLNGKNAKKRREKCDRDRITSLSTPVDDTFRGEESQL